MDRGILKYIFIGAVAIGAAVAVFFIARKGNGQSVEMGPAQTVEAFCRAVAEARFDDARALCDTVEMDAYIEVCRKAYEDAERQDSTVAAIAASILGEMQVTVGDVVKEGDGRSVFYTLGYGEGLTKEKVATVRKEEGAWKVTGITDRN